MGVTSSTLYVDGMTCPACETQISKSLMALGGVQEAKAQVRGGKVEVKYDPALVDPGIFKAAIENAGYSIRVKENSSTTIAIGIGVIPAALYLIASVSGLFNALPTVDASIGYAMLFVVALGFRMLGLLKGAPQFARFIPARLRFAGTRLALALPPCSFPRLELFSSCSSSGLPQPCSHEDLSPLW